MVNPWSFGNGLDQVHIDPCVFVFFHFGRQMVQKMSHLKLHILIFLGVAF